jgi:hypothetical protein
VKRLLAFVRRGIIIVPLLLAACAMTDVSNTTPPPALTLNAPPSLNFSGTCDQTKELEDWLQITTGLVTKFQTKMNEVAGMNRNDAYPPTLELVAMRDSSYSVMTPDCATDLELSLSDAMNRAVLALQEYVNGASSDISSAVAQANTQFDQITASQNELIQRLQTQIQTQAAQATTSP